MKFRGVKSLLEWYVYRRENPISSEGALESSLKQMQGDMATFGISASSTPQWVDAVHAIVDIESMLKQYPIYIRKAFIIYGIYDKTRAVLYLKGRHKYGKKTMSWGSDKTLKFFNSKLASFYKIACERDYIANTKKF